MNEIPRISEAEWDVLGVLWKNSPLTASQVFDALADREWKLNTVRTFLARLAGKGAIRSEETAVAKVFSPVLSREECVREASQTFLERVFGGAAGPLLVHFAKSRRLTETDLAELQAILDENRKGK